MSLKATIHCPECGKVITVTIEQHEATQQITVPKHSPPFDITQLLQSVYTDCKGVGKKVTAVGLST